MNDIAKEYQMQGASMMGLGNSEKAKEYFLKALAEEENSGLRVDLGNACASMEQYDEAVEAFLGALLSDPENGEILFDLGSVYLLQSKFKKALECYNKAEEVGFRKTILYTNFAAIYKSLGDSQLELRNYTKAIETNPLRGDLYVRKISLYIEQKRFYEALNTLEDLRKIVPDAFEGYDLAAKIYNGLGENQKAIEVLREGINKFPQDLNLQNSLVSLYLTLEDVKQAQKILNEMRDKSSASLFERAILFQEVAIASKTNNSDEMVEKLERILQLEEPETCDEQARYMLMMICMVQKKYERALDMAIELEKQDTDSHFMVAGIYYKGELLKNLGKEDEAKIQFKKTSGYLRKLSLQHNTFYECYVYRVMCYKELGEYEKALEMADFIESLQPEKSDAYVLRTDIYNQMGKSEKSEEQFRLAVQREPRLKRKD